jgi:integrase/recombinase XerC
LAEHLSDWEAELRTRPRGKRKRPPSPEHIRRTVGRVRRVLDGCRFSVPGDIALTPVQEFLQSLTADRQIAEHDSARESFTRSELAALLGVTTGNVRSLVKRHRLTATGNGKARRFPLPTVLALLKLARQGLGTCTAGYYARDIKAFTRWLAKRHRIAEDPLADLAGASGEDSDHRRDRRALDAAELRELLDAAAGSTRAFRGMGGVERRYLYLTAMGTGLRAGELASLCRQHFDLDGELPAVRVPADVAKNGKAAVQPIARDMADALRAFLAGRPDAGPLWPGTWHERAADMLRLDLEAAGIPYALEGPEGPLYADFHALRHSYVALLDRAGVTLKEAMHLARHADPKLTMKRYGKPQLHDLAAAIERLPRLLPDTPTALRNALAATGTDPLAYTPLTQTFDIGCDPVSSGVTGRTGDRAPTELPKSIRIKVVESDCDELRSTERSGTSRIRTCNQGIMRHKSGKPKRPKNPVISAILERSRPFARAFTT